MNILSTSIIKIIINTISIITIIATVNQFRCH